MLFIIFIFLFLIFFIRIITKHKGFFNFIRFLFTAYKEAFYEVYLFIKLEIYPYFTGKTVKNKPYDYSLWLKWKWKTLDKITTISRWFIYFWFFLMFFNIYNNGSIKEIYLLVNDTWLPFFLVLCKIPIFPFSSYLIYFNKNFFECFSFVF